ncbi:sulfur carrier protein [Allocatelliglobosispora scoriae]|uniref:Sulfur carrier protein n=1 Tax=Allocatelliglobosispora scoriae TaxID=643052 RepID=A0A841BXK7_9ACTN|nr:sulfur carrier protein ThiS [Allocatelliglobosispora scoriae]MBB5871502.1 sulfur carrier protein [Allocatelliglobosispora scoriae]
MIWINGTESELGNGTTVATIAAELELPERGVAVALNGEVVPRGGWPAAVLRDHDRLEILTATQGG